MEPIETLLVAAFDPKRLSYVVIGRPNMSFPGEDAARRAGCIVMPQAPRVGDVRGLSSTEIVISRTALGLQSTAPRVPVLSKVPGTVWQPPRPRSPADSQPAGPAPELNAPRARRR